MIDLVPLIALDARVFSEVECAPNRDPRAIHSSSPDLSKSAATLLRSSAADFSIRRPDRLGYLETDWQRAYISGLAGDFTARVNHIQQAAVALGTSRLVQTKMVASRRRALVFVDIRESVAIAALAQRLRRFHEQFYEGSLAASRDTPLLNHEQSFFQSLGLVALAAVGAYLDDASSRQQGQSSRQLRAGGFLSDRMGEGISSLLWVGGLCRAGRVDIAADWYPEWNPTTPAFILGHEFGHLYVGGPLYSGGITAGIAHNKYAMTLWQDASEFAERMASRTLDGVRVRDRAAAEECRLCLPTLGKSTTLAAETFPDVIEMIAATSVLTDDGSLAAALAMVKPHPPTDRRAWITTSVAVALVHSARMIGVALSKAGTTENQPRLDFGEALGSYLLRAWTTVLATITIPLATDQPGDLTDGDQLTTAGELIGTGLQLLVGLRNGLVTLLEGGATESAPWATVAASNGAHILGIRLGDSIHTTVEDLVSDLDGPSRGIEAIQSAYDSNVEALFDTGGQPHDTLYHRDLETVAPELGDKARARRWES